MRALVIGLFMLVSGALSAATVTIDFEEFGDEPLRTLYPATWSSKGYTISGSPESSDSPESFAGSVNGATYGVPDPVSGSKLLIFCASSVCFPSEPTFTLTNDNGVDFDLLSVDFAATFATTSLEVKGYFSGGGTISSSLAADGAGWQTLSLGAAWTGLERVEFISSLGDGFESAGIDNVVVQAVPIPAAVWLFGSALAGLGWHRRKRLT